MLRKWNLSNIDTPLQSLSNSIHLNEAETTPSISPPFTTKIFVVIKSLDSYVKLIRETMVFENSKDFSTGNI